MRYLDSKFIGHAIANDLLGGGNHMNQVSLDGSSTKWNFYEMLLKDRIEKEQHELTDIESCSLHVIHGAFITGVESSVWNIQAIFKGVFTILHNIPARRKDFIATTGEERFPLFFCAIWWVEERIVVDRLVQIWDSIIKIVCYWEKLPKSKQPSFEKLFERPAGCQWPIFCRQISV